MEKLQELKTRPVSRLFWRYSLPSVAGTLSLAIYYIIDSVFLGFGPGLGDHAIGALGVLLPIMSILSALGTLVGVGSASRISIYYGQGDMEMVRRIMGTSLVLTLLVSLVPILIILIFMQPMLYALGATAETFDFAREFLWFYLPASLFLNMGTTLTGILRVSGMPGRAMLVLAMGVVFNLIFAPLFIFVLEWGMKGAGGATLLATLLSACIVVPHFLGKNSLLPVRAKYLNLEGSAVLKIISIGFAPFLITAMTALIVLFVNRQLIFYGDASSLEGYVIATRFHYLFTMIFAGISQGIQPIIGYNFGAGDYKRLFKTLNYAFVVAFCVGLLAMLAGLFAGEYMVRIFNPSDVVIGEAKTALFILTVTLPLAGCQILMSGFFQHIGKAGRSAALSALRLVLLIPLIHLLPLALGLSGVWATLPIAELWACLLTAAVFIYSRKHLPTTMSDK